MIIGVIYEPDEFIDILTHELIHRLLTDNRTLPYDLFLIPHWENLFGKNHSFNTLVHIPVHAVHKAVYLDALKDAKRLERDIKRHQKYGNKDYTAAWDYVESRGYEDIIACLKRQCQVLGKKK
jgi:hypothetical protein